MLLLLQLLFWGSVLAITHSYVIYPLIVKLLARGRQTNDDVYALDNPQTLPVVTIMMAVYNEERVLEQKLRSIFDTRYPLDKIEVLIGSDNSNDRSHEILEHFARQYPQLRYSIFQRQGKANILNNLQRLAQGTVYIFTDANVFFAPDTIYQLAKHFKNPKIGQVGAAFVNSGVQTSGISMQEKSYIGRETGIKLGEGLLWGAMMGAFGGCHALRASLFVPNPPHFFMEDFYISMHILREGYNAILEPKAIVYEDVSNEVSEEFKRKTRISVGNFQNLSVFYPLLFSIRRPGMAFAFWSHKLLRWFGPFFMLIAFISNALLAYWGWAAATYFYPVLFLLYCLGLFGVPVTDALLRRMGIHLWLLRAVGYFIAMNTALLIGFFKYLKGVKSNVWQPTKRNT